MLNQRTEKRLPLKFPGSEAGGKCLLHVITGLSVMKSGGWNFAWEHYRMTKTLASQKNKRWRLPNEGLTENVAEAYKAPRVFGGVDWD